MRTRPRFPDPQFAIPFLTLLAAFAVSAAVADERLEGIACRSVHLAYPAAEGAAFYNEVAVERSAPGTYFCVCGFRQGYYGIQELGNGKKLLIFSIWDPGRQDDPNVVADEQRVRLVHKHPKVRVGRFGGEGTGGQSFYDFDWRLGQTYRFLVTAKRAGKRTEFTAWFFEPDAAQWARLVTFSTLAGGKLLGGYYSFVEDFQRDRVSATRLRKAAYGNGWVQTEEGRWQSLSRAKFTADANPVKNIDAGVAEKRFFLATGGDAKNSNSPLWSEMSLEAPAAAPKDVVDLLARDAKADALQATPPPGATAGRASSGARRALIPVGGAGHKILLAQGDARLPLVVVRGTPYEMGRHLGRLMGDDMRRMIPAVMGRLRQGLDLPEAKLLEAWSRTAPFTDDRVEQEMLGLADGSGVPLATLQAVHAIPLLMPYSCSSIAAWGKATVDGHLYQTRNLDWKLAAGAHDFPMIVVYAPSHGNAHVILSFAGMIGAHTGMNVRGIALSEMGDSPAREAPYDVDAVHFTMLFRTLLYDADSLARALEIFQGATHTKRYHYVFGDGLRERRAVKIVAHTPKPPDQRIRIFNDNDPADEFAPAVLPCVVYNDEGRGAFPLLKRDYGKLDAEKMIAIANHIPIRGGNCVDVVYDATALKLWVSYAKGKQEAYQRPYAMIDLRTLDADGDGKPDLAVP